MGDKMLSYLAVIGTVLFTVGGQLLMKWRVARLTPAADGAADHLRFALDGMRDIWIWLGMGMGFLAAVSWIIALARLQLSEAYPFTALALVLVTTVSVLVLGEPLTAGKTIGVALIAGGVIVLGWWG